MCTEETTDASTTGPVRVDNRATRGWTVTDLIHRLLSIKDAAQVLAIPETTLRDKVTAGQVPHTRIGRHVRFTLRHLELIVEAGERPVRASVADCRPTRRRRRKL